MSVRAVMDGKPDRRLGRVRPFDAVPPMRRDVDELPRLEQDGFGGVIEREPRLPPQKQNPFAVRLVVPEDRRARLSARDDSLDPYTRTREQLRKLLDAPVERQVEKDVPWRRRDRYSMTVAGFVGSDTWITRYFTTSFGLPLRETACNCPGAS